MNAAREMVREWYPEATPEQVERFAAAIYRAMLSTPREPIRK